MPYVSAHYAPPDPFTPEAEGHRRVIATDDNGVDWWLTEDSQVGDWLTYIEGGGTIAPADPAALTDQNILAAPDDLFGGPTIEQVLSGG